MKNLLDDPDVMALYKDLQNNKYENIDDYLTSFPETSTHSDHGGIPIHMISNRGLPKPDRKIFWEGQEITMDFEEDNDYGL